MALQALSIGIVVCDNDNITKKVISELSIKEKARTIGYFEGGEGVVVRGIKNNTIYVTTNNKNCDGENRVIKELECKENSGYVKVKVTEKLLSDTQLKDYAGVVYWCEGRDRCIQEIRDLLFLYGAIV